MTIASRPKGSTWVHNDREHEDGSRWQGVVQEVECDPLVEFLALSRTERSLRKLFPKQGRTTYSTETKKTLFNSASPKAEGDDVSSTRKLKEPSEKRQALGTRRGYNWQRSVTCETCERNFLRVAVEQIMTVGRDNVSVRVQRTCRQATWRATMAKCQDQTQKKGLNLELQNR